MTELFLPLVCLFLSLEALIVTEPYDDEDDKTEVLSSVYWIVAWFLLYVASTTVELP